uniref:Secreted peptide prohormone-16 n=1 Tax=Schmidtea mediterranea TaxID=79327 RepID=E3CTL7_SCHMD|nr:TPA_inf: secreted peptide prohormone-16 [Schmidtea mediterranea]
MKIYILCLSLFFLQQLSVTRSFPSSNEIYKRQFDPIMYGKLRQFYRRSSKIGKGQFDPTMYEKSIFAKRQFDPIMYKRQSNPYFLSDIRSIKRQFDPIMY